MAILELRKVRKSHGTPAVEVLHNVSLDVQKGELVAILGPSGAGKTTLISLIAGLIRPDGGTIVFNEKEVVEPGPDRGVVFQNYSLLPWLTVRENVQLSVDQAYASWPSAKRRKHAELQVDRVKLTHALHKRPHELSGGMRQRVALARALAADPQLLLLDEPLSALDALTRANLQDEIERLWRESRKTVILITNDVDEAILLADRIIPMTAGPGATLGASIVVEIPRPRDRKGLNCLPRFKEIRAGVIGALLAARASGEKRSTPRAFEEPEPFEAADLLSPPLRHPERIQVAS